MKVLVTGLCLQGNKGGPALALSLRERLRERLGPCEIVLSVPRRDLAQELVWAERYDFAIVPDFHLRDLVPWPPRRKASARVLPWLRELRASDVLVEMSAISYVGPPAGTVRRAVAGRFRYFLLALLLGVPMRAWTQSYGPFSTRLLRVLARLDLRRQPVIFCRGDDCADAVAALVPGCRVQAYPDVAVTLAWDPAEGASQLSRQWPSLAGKFVTLSPSAVLYGKAPGAGNDNGHVRAMVALVGEVRALGLPVLLVPHTRRSDDGDPRDCDLAVARLVGAACDDAEVRVVTEDLSAPFLKSIISGAVVHVGARYHSIVASLSTGVPTVALSWHPKYRDIMRIYGLEDFVVEDGADAAGLVRDLLDRRDEVHAKLLEHGAAAEAAVQRNADEFCRLLVEATS